MTKMDRAWWKLTVQANLRALAEQVTALTPGTLYGRLAAATLTPVMAALAAGDYRLLVTLFELIGSINGNLIANSLQDWQGLNEPELASELTAKSAADLAWRETIDKLLREFGAPDLVLANLNAAERAWFTASLQREAARLGSTVTAGCDVIMGSIRAE